MKKTDPELYTDYVLSTWGAATGLSAMVDGDVSHDRITRFLSIAVVERARASTPQVFTNKDASTGILHLVCSDLTSDYDAIITSYKKRWQVDVFHKSLKSNAGLAKSPTQTLSTQSNHVFMAIYAVFMLECLSVKSKLNHFAMRLKLLVNASRSAYDQLRHWQVAA